MADQSESSAFPRLWAPWRLPWIKQSSGGDIECFLCEYLESEPDKDRENLVIYRGERALIVMNRYPYTNGHLMVAPNRHLNDPRLLEPEEWAEVGLLTQVCLEALTTTINPHGFNIGWNVGLVSGAGLEQHLHQHIVPRWNGDTNFMPVVGRTKVISQDLWEAYDLIHEAVLDLKHE